MTDASPAAPSSSKRMKKSSPHASNEQLKLQLDSEKSLHDVQCFTEGIFAIRKSSSSVPALNSFVDPVVNLNIELLTSNIKSSSDGVDAKSISHDSDSIEALLKKLCDENDSLKRKDSVNKSNERLSQRKDTIISDLRKEVAKLKSWTHDLQEQNDRLSSQVFMQQMQQSCYQQEQQQHQKHNDGSTDAAYPADSGQKIKNEYSGPAASVNS